MNRSLQIRILEELSFTNLTTARLSAILDVKVSDLKDVLRELEEAGSVRHLDKGEEKVWELIDPCGD